MLPDEELTCLRAHILQKATPGEAKLRTPLTIVELFAKNNVLP
jgi:hypothetical protein